MGIFTKKSFHFFLKNQFSISVLKIENGILSASISILSEEKRILDNYYKLGI